MALGVQRLKKDIFIKLWARETNKSWHMMSRYSTWLISPRDNMMLQC